MPQQKSEPRELPQTRRKTGSTGRVAPSRGGKTRPVPQSTAQLSLPFETVENPRPQAVGVSAQVDAGQPAPAPSEALLSKVTTNTAPSAMMQEVCAHLSLAFLSVESNRGAPGPDRQTVQLVREHWPQILSSLQQTLLDGTYRPGDIRRVWIPKATGGQRALGIPNVVDRIVQEAVRRVLEPLYEPFFHPSSHGFRPGRSCHTAITQAKSYIEEGFAVVVDIDLEKFFDRIHHQRLLSRLAEQVKDKSVLTLIHRMLKTKVVMPDGVRVSNDEGVPQGGPLSPLLSNIVLDELDRELSRRGHRFVRYADDANIYVSSIRAGQRVMANVTKFIEQRLKLKVNEAKSAVAHPEERHFVGFSLRRNPEDGSAEVLLSQRTRTRIQQKLTELIPRNWGNSPGGCIHQLNVYLRGWLGFFGIVTAGAERELQYFDAHCRRRLRALKLHDWKTKRTIASKLIDLGVKRKTAWRRVYTGKKRIWAMAHDAAVDRGLPNAYFAKSGLYSLHENWTKRNSQNIKAPEQINLNWDSERSKTGQATG